LWRADDRVNDVMPHLDLRRSIAGAFSRCAMQQPTPDPSI
jgi:hypothetical protein